MVERIKQLVSLLVLVLSCSCVAHAWVPAKSLQRRHGIVLDKQKHKLINWRMTASALDPQQQEPKSPSADDDFEYVEYDYLSESDFLNSEWVVGTLYNNNDSKIQETWVRLARTEEGKNVCIWGTNERGTWNLDVASQFLSMSREKLYGKEIWACTVDDYYYLQGTVRGWAFWKAASVYGQWQAARLGVAKDEAGIAPWFQDDDNESTATETLNKDDSEI
jgi:hypothetical protein